MNTLAFLLKVTRFPYYWIWTPGFFIWGFLLSGSSIESVYTASNITAVILFFWFMVPGNLFMNITNDANDYDTDSINPRKGGDFEIRITPDQKKNSLLIGWCSLATILFFLPFLSLKILLTLGIWVLAIYFYNTPPFRFKARPFTELIFGGMGHFGPVFAIGSLAGSGTFLDWQYTLWISIFGMACIVFANAIDYYTDKLTSIRNTNSLFKSDLGGFILSLLLFIVFTVYGFYIGLIAESYITILYIALVLTVFNKKIRENKVLLYRMFITSTCILGIGIGFIFIY